MGTAGQSPRFLVRNIVLHLLAFVVFLFAVQAKLVLYEKAPEPALAAAKLSTEKNTSNVFSAISKLKTVDGPPDLEFVALQLLASFRSIGTPTLAYSAQIKFAASVRMDLQGVSHFYRPPPTLL
jgi:hypothetical protein